MEQVIQEQPPKLRKIYDYLKRNNLVKSSTYEDWEKKMQEPQVAEKTYNYLRDAGKVKAKDFNEFQTSVGLKKKDSTQLSSAPAQPISDPQVLESGLTEEEEKQRNLQALSQQPVAQQPNQTPEQPVAAPEVNTPEILGNVIGQQNPLMRGIYDLGRKFISVLKDDLPAAFATTKQMNSNDVYEDYLNWRSPNKNNYKESYNEYLKRSGKENSDEVRRAYIAEQEIGIVGEDEFKKQKSAFENQEVKDKAESFKESKVQHAEADKFLKGIPKTWKEAEGAGDVSSYIGSAIGQGLAQIPAAVATRGMSSYFLEKSDAYNEGVEAIAKEMNITPAEVVEKNLDEPAQDVSKVVALVNASLDAFSAGKLINQFGKNQLKKKVQEEVLKKGIWQQIKKSKGVDVANKALTEYVTEFAQETDTQFGGQVAAGKAPEEAFQGIDFERSHEAGLKGLIAGGGISMIANATPKTKSNETAKPTAAPEAGAEPIVSEAQKEESIPQPQTEEPAQALEVVVQDVPDTNVGDIAESTEKQPDKNSSGQPVVEEPVPVDQKSGAIVPRQSEKGIPETDPKVDGIKKTLVDAGKIVSDEKGLTVKQNSGYPSESKNHLSKLKDDLLGSVPEQQTNVRTDATLKVLDFAAKVYKVQPYKEGLEGDYVSWLQSLGDEGYEASRLLNSPRRAIEKLSESEYYKALTGPKKSESLDDKHEVMKKKQLDTISSAAKKWDTLSESDQANIKQLAKSWLMEELIPKRETPSTEGEISETKSDTDEKGRKGQGRQGKRLLTQQQPEAEAQASAPSETISVGSDIYFDWLGRTKKGRITEMLSSGKVKIKGSDGLSYTKPASDISQIESEVKKAAPKDAEKVVEYNSKRKKPIGIVGDPNSGFMFQTDMGKTIAKFMQKQFTAKGFLPRGVFDRWISAKGEISRYESQIKFTVSDMKNAIREEYGDKLTDAQITDINLALQGKDPRNPIPPKTKALVQEMRDQIDNLTMRFIDEGVVAGDMSETFAKNLGSYITRSYRKYDDPFWAEFVPEEVKNKAMAFLRAKYPNHSQEEMDGLINFLLYDSDAPMSVMKGGKLGSKDLSILKKRGDIAPEIRALLGEYGDPLLNYARSVTKMAGLIAKHHFLEDVKAQGMDKFLFEKPTGKFFVPIAAEGSQTMAPLNGLYTTEEIAEAFNEFNEQDPIADWLRYYMKINAYVKSGKTVFSVMTHARNFFGNLGFVIANGHWRLNKAGQAAQTAWANVYSNDKVIREKLQEYIQLGIVQDSAMGGQLKAYLDDIRGGQGLFQKVNESRLKRIKNGILDVTQNLYQFEDDLYKIFAFENEKARYAKAFPGMPEDQLNQKAADIVRNTYPTYSLVPRIVKNLRLNPFVGTFVSFPSEVIRTTYNTAALAKEELSNPSTRDIGALRLAGLMSALLLPTIASYYSMFALGMDGEDDEDVKKFVAPWQKTSEFLYLGRDGAKYNLIDLGFSDPHSYLKRPIQSILNEDDLTKGGIKAIGEILEPFLSEEMLTARLIDVKRNEKETGDHVYNPDAPVGDRLRDIYAHMSAAGEPGTFRSIENIYKGINGKTDKYGKAYNLQNEIAAALTGQRIESKDISQALLFRAYEIKDRFDRAEKDYYRVSKSKSTTPEEIADAERKFKAANASVIKDAIDFYRSAIRLGIDPKEAKKTLSKTQNKELKKLIRAEQKK